MDPTQIILAGTIIAAACALQSMIGFGAGLFGIPLLVWSGLTLPDAVTVSVVVAGAQEVWGAWRHRHEVPWKPIVPIVLYRFLTLPLGVMMLGVVVTLGRDAVQQAVGWGLLATVALIEFIKVKPQPQVGHGWGAAAGVTSGFLSGLLGMGGPPMVLWVLAHDWTADRARAAIWAMSATALPATLLLLGWQFGADMLDGLLLGVICMPFTMVGSSLGFRFNGLLCRTRLRRASLAVLVLIGASAILGPVLRPHPTALAAPAQPASGDVVEIEN